MERLAATFNTELPPAFTQYLQELHFAYQPIVNIHTGMVFGWEALLRGWDQAGFPSIQAFFDLAADKGILYGVDLHLREKCIRDFLDAKPPETCHLFYNLDNRLLQMENYSSGNTLCLLEQYGLATGRIYFEVSERHPLEGAAQGSAVDVLNQYKEQHFHIALDDFGSGYAGLQMLYRAEPDLIKIDRFFISGIDSDARKKLFIANMVETAHIMGVTVVAEGVESEDEFLVCRDIGCDYVQGYFIQKPQIDRAMLQERYTIVADIVRKDQRRSRISTRELMLRELDRPQPIQFRTPVLEALGFFRENPQYRFFPVVNELGEALGLLEEKEVKSYVYSPFGFSLIQNKSCGISLERLMSPCPQVEINTRLERVLEALALDRKAEALIITDNGRYQGLLHSRALIQILHEIKLMEARDQNPLTKLPGNLLIQEYLAERLAFPEEPVLLVYFDFDNFKPFNDTYGFRQGDRVIQLFADLFRARWNDPGTFLGHIGGDDFFLGLPLKTSSLEEARERIEHFLNHFAEDVRAFYPNEIQTQGYLLAKDRGGRKRRFGLLTVSAAALLSQHLVSTVEPEDIGRILAEVKSQAKCHPGRLVICSKEKLHPVP